MPLGLQGGLSTSRGRPTGHGLPGEAEFGGGHWVAMSRVRPAETNGGNGVRVGMGQAAAEGPETAGR